MIVGWIPLTIFCFAIIFFDVALVYQMLKSIIFDRMNFSMENTMKQTALFIINIIIIGCAEYLFFISDAFKIILSLALVP